MKDQEILDRLKEVQKNLSLLVDKSFSIYRKDMLEEVKEYVLSLINKEAERIDKRMDYFGGSINSGDFLADVVKKIKGMQL